MGNEQSTLVKAESEDYSEGAKYNSRSSPPDSGDFVFSSQVDPPVGSPELFLQVHRNRMHRINPDLPSTSPLIPTYLAQPINPVKTEVSESPEYNRRTSAQVYEPIKPENRGSSNSPYLNSDSSSMSERADNAEQPASLNDTLLPKRHRRRKRREKRPQRTQMPPLASPDLSNDQLPSNVTESRGAQNLLPLRRTNATPAEPTSSNAISSKKRKAKGSSSQATNKKRKNSHEENSLVDNTTSFSGLVESLYAGRRNNENLEAEEDDSMDNDIKAKSSNESDHEPLSRQSATSTSNMSNVDPDSESDTNSDAAPGDEMEEDISEHNPAFRNGNEPNDVEVTSHGDEQSSDNAESDDQDEMIGGDDGRNSEESKDEEIDDGVQNEGVRNNTSTSQLDADGTNDEYHPDDDEELPKNTRVGSRPKQNSARKRFIKPTFYERLAEGVGDSTTGRSSSPIAGSSKRALRKQSKISTMLKGNAEDSPAPKTPSQKRRPGPKTKISEPHELVTGQFSDFELRNITQAVEHWRDDHNLTQIQVNALIQGNPKEVKSQGFWTCIVSTCPNRPRQKVINQCRRKFHNFVARGTWTPEQNDELRRVWEIKGNKYSLIGKIINRHPEDVRDRIRNYVVCGENRRSTAWSMEEEEKLETIISQALEVIRDHRDEGKLTSEEPDEDLIDWQRVSELMDRTRSRLQCIQKWKTLSRQRAGRGSIDGSEILSIDQIIQMSRNEAASLSGRERYSIIKAIRATDANADSRIPWAKVRSTHLADQWGRPTIILVWHRLKCSLPDWNIMSVPEIIQQLSSRYRTTHKLEFPSGENYDVIAEYTEMENKVSNMLRAHHHTPKTPDIVVKTDDEDEDESNANGNHEGGKEAGDSGEGSESEVDPEENNGVDQNGNTSMKDETDEESDDSVDLGNDKADEIIPRDLSVGSPSISNFKSRRVQRGQKRYSSSSKIAHPRKPTPNKHKSTRKVIEESSDDEQDSDVAKEPSSDTNASDVESIPAH
ncbi:hypothetical protein F4804DRAFT_317696 [Jackrogersella minutella]|nr:hypothetical protein F4804DRAFT_317696 [Jackrogersella minutella]